ncbi:Ras GTPase activating protein ira2 [Sorochytrium milnesiophthora]
MSDSPLPPRQQKDDLDLVITVVNKFGTQLPVQSKVPLRTLRTRKPFQNIVTTILVLAKTRRDELLSCIIALGEELVKVMTHIEDISDLCYESVMLLFQVLADALNKRHGKPEDDSGAQEKSTMAFAGQKPSTLSQDITTRAFDLLMSFLVLTRSNANVLAADLSTDMDASPLIGMTGVSDTSGGGSGSVGSGGGHAGGSGGGMSASSTATGSAATNAKVRNDRLAAQGAASAAQLALFSLSGLNWPGVYPEILKRIQVAYAQDMLQMFQSECRLLRCLYLDLNCLLEVLNDIVPKLKSYEKPYLKEMLSALHCVAWSWLERQPAEFRALYQRQSPVKGLLSVHFNTIYALYESSKKKHYTWPLLNFLALTTPDKEFLDMLRKQLSQERMKYNAALCFVDICKGASYLPKDRRHLLQHIAPAVDQELRQRLFDLGSPIVAQEQEQTFVVECFVALFLSDPISSCKTLAPYALESSASLLQTLALRGLQRVARDKTTLKDTPDDAVGVLCDTLRRLLKRGATGDDEAPSSNKKLEKRKSKQMLEERTRDLALLSHILDVYMLDPTLCFRVAKPDMMIPAGEQVLRCLAACLTNDHLDISSKSYSLLTMLLHNEAQILSAHDSKEYAKKLLTHLRDLLQMINSYIGSRKEVATTLGALSERIAMNNDMEMIMLVSLCSPDTENVSLTLSIIRRLCVQAHLTDDLESPIEQPFVQCYGMYRDMSEPEAFTVYGRWQQTLEVLQSIASKDPGTEAEQKSKKPSSKQPKTEAVVLSPDDTIRWGNMTGLLCSLGQCCLAQPFGDIRASVTSGSALSGEEENVLLVKHFIGCAVDLLCSPHLTVKESARDMLAHELSPMLQPLLFEQLERVNAALFPSDDFEPSDRVTDFVEQQVALIKSLLDQVQSYEFLPEATLRDLCLRSCRYLDRLSVANATLRTRIRFAQLMEVLMKNKNGTALAEDRQFRRVMTDTLLTWLVQYDEVMKLHDGEAVRMSKLYQDLAIQCLRALKELADGLTIEDTGASEKNEPHHSAFYHVLSPLLNILQRCKATDEQVLHVSNAHGHAKEMLAIKEITISVVSVLLSSNVGSGLKYFIIMGYHEDLEFRSAFMEVLRNTLRQGIDLATEEKAQSVYDDLTSLLLDPNMVLVDAVCETAAASNIDDMALCLFNVFQYHEGDLLALVRRVLQLEVAKAETAATLFRRNSMATKMLTIYGKAFGQDYLRETLMEPMKALYASTLAFEVDSSKLKPSENRKTNVENLIQMTQTFLDTITDSAAAMPKHMLLVMRLCRALRAVCEMLSTLTARRFAGAESVAVGGFVFLRYFCPAIVAGDLWDQVEKPKNMADLARARVLIAKVIQNISNAVVFGQKENFMIDLNPYVRDSMPVVTKYLQRLAKEAYGRGILTMSTSVDQRHETELEALHRYLAENLERVNAYILQPAGRAILASDAFTVNERSGLTAQEVHDQLTTSLIKLGPPAPARKTIATSETHDHELKEFQQRNAAKDIQPLQQLNYIYQHGSSKAFVYYIARRLLPGQCDMELVVYHVISVLKELQGKPFEMVVDLTLFRPCNEVQMTWLALFVRMMPRNIFGSFTTVYALHSNNTFRKFVKHLPKSWAIKALNIAKSVSLAELGAFIPMNQLKLPTATASLDSDVAVFTGLVRISSSYIGAHPFVQVKVSNEFLQIIGHKKVDFLSQMTAMYDVYHLSEIESTALIAAGDGKLIVKLAQGMQIALSGAKCEELEQTLRKKRSRFNIARSAKDEERTVSAADIPGTLLNMAFFNLLSDYHKLRSNALGLLKAIMGAFDIHVEPDISGMSDIPALATTFISNLSEHICSAAPHFTLEVISEFCVGFQQVSLASRPLCLVYIQPWIVEFGEMIARDQHTVRVKEVLQRLLMLTLDQAEAHIEHRFNIVVWQTLGANRDSVRNVVTEVTQDLWKKVQTRVHVARLTDVMASLGAQHADVVSEVLVNWMIRIMQETPVHLQSGGGDASSFKVTVPELSVATQCLLRFSFANEQLAELHLPEIFYVVLLLSATGSIGLRMSIYGLLVNVLNSTAACTWVSINAAAQAALQARLHELTEEKFRLMFGLSGSVSTSSLERVPTGDSHSLLDTPPWKTWKHLQAYIMTLFQTACPTGRYGAYRARLVQRLEHTAFSYQCHFRSRSIACFGHLLEDDVTFDTIQRLIAALKIALGRSSAPSEAYGTGVLTCMLNVAPKLSDAEHLRGFFWLAMSSFCYSESSQILDVVLSLLHEVIKALDDNGYLIERDLETVLLGDVPAYVQQLSAGTGLAFDGHFAFAVASSMVRGLRRPECKQQTVSLLLRCLHVARNTPQDDIRERLLVGFLSPFFSFPLRDLMQALAIGGIDTECDGLTTQQPDGASTYDVLSKLDVTESRSAVLLLASLAFQLEHCQNQEERLQLFRHLTESTTAFPNQFSLILDQLLPTIDAALAQTHNQEIMDAAAHLLKAFLGSESIQARVALLRTSERGVQSALTALRFTGLGPLFDPARPKAVLSDSISIIASIADAIAAHAFSS